MFFARTESIISRDINWILRLEEDHFEYLSFRVLLALSFGEGSGTPLQYSCLENPMDGGAWRAAVHGVTEGQT